jgi:drug/metabolite transporter (DMT)-like permease
MLFVLFGIISALSFGVSNVYWKAAAKDVDYPYLVFFRGVISSLLFGLIWLGLVYTNTNMSGITNASATAYDYISSIALCLLGSLGLLFFLKSMKYAPVSITVALASVNITRILTAVFIIGEQFTVIYLLSFSLAILGILFSRNFDFKQFSMQWNKGATYALLASFFWGITYPFFKFVSPAVGAMPLSFILETSVTVTALIWIATSSNRTTVTKLLHKRLLKHYGILSVLLVGGTLFFNLAIQQISVLKLDLLSNFQIVVSIVLGIFMYQEKLTKQQMVGIVLILLSIAVSQYLQ